MLAQCCGEGKCGGFGVFGWHPLASSARLRGPCPSVRINVLGGIGQPHDIGEPGDGGGRKGVDAQLGGPCWAARWVPAASFPGTLHPCTLNTISEEGGQGKS